MQHENSIRQLEGQLRETQLLLAAKDEVVVTGEREIQRIKELYLAVTDPSLGPAAASAAHYRGITVISSQPPSISRAEPAKGPGAQPKGDADVVQALRSQLETSQHSQQEMQRELTRLRSAVDLRERELARSQRMLASDPGPRGENEGITSSSRLQHLEAVDVANKRVIDQLNAQVDFLNEQLAARETQLRNSPAIERAQQQVPVSLVQDSSSKDEVARTAKGSVEEKQLPESTSRSLMSESVAQL